MLMYKLREHSNNYSKTSGSLWQSYRDETPITDAMLALLLIFMLAITVLRLNLGKNNR